MLEALYNITLLGEVWFLTYSYGKLGLDFLWGKTVEFMCERNLWSVPEIEQIMSMLTQEKNG